jgi:NitT/TauT family transport system permease protein
MGSDMSEAATSPAVRKFGVVRARKKRPRSVFKRLVEPLAAWALALVLIGAWQISVPLSGLSDFVLPTPWSILKRMIQDRALLLDHAWITVFEVVAGFAIAAVTGITTALAIFFSRTFERAVYPLLVALQTVPKVALAPLIVIYLGYGWGPKVFLSFLISYFPIVIATVVGLQSLEKGLVNMARSMGANGAHLFFKIRLPTALPSIFGGFKVAIALAVIGAIIGEYVAAEKGLGYLQLQANANFDTTLNFACVIMIALVGVGLYFAIMLIEGRVVYRREDAK